MVSLDSPKLNSQQKEAVEHKNGPLLIIAGAGTGKTTVITERIKHLILKKLAKPEEILALTFTEKASLEMQERTDAALPYGSTPLWISTFHSFCDRILRDEALQIGLDTKYKLLTQAEAIRFLRDNLFEFDLHYFRPLGNPNKFIGALLQHFSRLADEDVSPSEYLTWANSKFEILNSKEKKLENEKWLELANAYSKYEELKIEKSFVDYANLIGNTLKLFRERPNVLEEYRKKFKYLLVDEYQDTNIAQNELVKLLVNHSQNITVVADDDQSIYKWRGAAVSNVLQFRENFPKVKVVSLTQNYRSTQTILDASYNLIQKNNPDRLEVKEGIDKKLISARKEKGASPEFVHTDRVENEAEIVAQKIITLVNENKYSFKDFAVLVRANNHADPFVKAFRRLGIPHQFLGPAKLFQQEEIRCLIAYLKVLYNQDDWGALYKLLSFNLLEIDPEIIAKIVTFAKKYNYSLYESILKAKDEKVKRLANFIGHNLKLVPKKSATQLIYDFVLEIGGREIIVNPKNQDEEKFAFDVTSFLKKLQSFEADHDDASVYAVVDWIDLLSEVGESPASADFDWNLEDAVNILTVHASKGLEFPVVFVANLVAQRFPTTERGEAIPIPEELIREELPSGDYHLQEERRLFYVAMTRAKDLLYITAADYYGEGKREKKLSPFIFDTFGEQILDKDKDKEMQISALDFSSNVKMQPNSMGQLPTTHNSQLTTITYLSYSQIETFRFCPLHYKLHYILNIPTFPTASLSFGNTLHKVLYEFNKSYLQGLALQNPEDILLELLNKHWIKLGYDSKKHEQMMKKRGEEYLKNYLKSDLYDPKNPPQLLEQKFKFPVDGCQIGGVMDRVDTTPTGIEIIDYKTTDFLNKDLPTEREMKKNLQLSIYALAATKPIHEVLGKKPEEITLSLYFFDLGKKVSTTRSLKELAEAEKEIIKVKQEIETSDFQCSGNYFCANCEYKMFCKVES